MTVAHALPRRAPPDIAADPGASRRKASAEWSCEAFVQPEMRLVPLLLLVLSCADHSVRPASEPARPTRISFEEAEHSARECGESKRCTVANVGTCGDHHFIETVESFIDTFEYFDSSGALVARCQGNIEHGGTVCSGQVPHCSRSTVDRRFGISR